MIMVAKTAAACLRLVVIGWSVFFYGIQLRACGQDGHFEASFAQRVACSVCGLAGQSLFRLVGVVAGLVERWFVKHFRFDCKREWLREGRGERGGEWQTMLLLGLSLSPSTC